MSVFRVYKNKNYTVLSNYHLRDKNLSLKSIGLLSIILSLPDNWDYSQAGLAAICKDGEDSVRSGLKELEKYGYLERERERDKNGKMRGVVYKIYEVPKNASSCYQTGDSKDRTNTHTKPKVENPMLGKPAFDCASLTDPKQENPILGEQRQINKEKEINTDDNKYQSINQSMQENLTDGLIDRENTKNILKENIHYSLFAFKSNFLQEKLDSETISLSDYNNEILYYDIKLLDKVIEYMLDLICSTNSEPVKIGDDLIDRRVVADKLLNTTMLEMKNTLFSLNTQNIKNPKKYAISMLYNS